MATARVSWPGEVVQEPAGAMDTASWQVKVYQESDGLVLNAASEPREVLFHDFALGEGSYHAGVQAIDVNGQPAGLEVLSSVFTISPEGGGTVDVLRSGPVTVEVTA